MRSAISEGEGGSSGRRFVVANAGALFMPVG